MTKRDDKDFEDLQRTLLRLHDELTETFAWTALLCDGLCGLMVDETANVDSVTYTGMRFAASWLKGRNQRHAAALQAACRRLCDLRERKDGFQPGRAPSLSRGK